MQESSSDKFASANMRLSVWQVHALELQKHQSKKNTISNDGAEKWKGLNFTDVAEDIWYAKAVNTLGSLGIISGAGNGKFDPNRAISRAEFCTIVSRFAKVASTVESSFDDIKDSDWYYKAVTTAASYGWVTGMNDGKFHPSKVISRAQAATIINRMLGAAADRSYVDSHVTNPYTDVSKTHWAYYQIMEATIAHDHGYDKEGVEIWKGLK